MENRNPLGRCLIGIYVILLSLPIFIAMTGALSHLASGGQIIILGYFIIAALFIAMIYGLFANQRWVEPLAKYIYPFSVIPVLLIGSFSLTAMSGLRAPPIFIFTLIGIFDVLFLVYVFPLILYFYFPEMKRLSLWLKIVLLAVCVCPAVALFIFRPF